eukprot:15189370-Alexandrium_andersonii.AAC.1
MAFEDLVAVVLSGKAVANKAQCYKHSRVCCCRSADVHIGGTPCVAFSPQGSRSAGGHASTLAFLVWAAHRLQCEEGAWRTQLGKGGTDSQVVACSAVQRSMCMRFLWFLWRPAAGSPCVLSFLPRCPWGRGPHGVPGVPGVPVTCPSPFDPPILNIRRYSARPLRFCDSRCVAGPCRGGILHENVEEFPVELLDMTLNKSVLGMSRGSPYIIETL